MIVRQAIFKDRDQFVRLANSFYKESGYDFELDQGLLINNFVHSIDSDNVKVFVIQDGNKLVGMIVGGIQQTLFSKDLIATELAWFVEEEYRGNKISLQLLEMYEEWARESGCTFVTMVDIDPLNNLQKLYERKGYSLKEKTYVKRF